MEKFELRAKAHVQKIIRVRKNLLAHHKGIDNAMMKATLEKVEKQFALYPYASDQKMARFIFRYAAELAFLTPGTDSGSHNSMMCELNALLSQASTLIAHAHAVC
jgi:hypothetical protein